MARGCKSIFKNGRCVKLVGISNRKNQVKWNNEKI